MVNMTTGIAYKIKRENNCNSGVELSREVHRNFLAKARICGENRPPTLQKWQRKS